MAYTRTVQLDAGGEGRSSSSGSSTARAMLGPAAVYPAAPTSERARTRRQPGDDPLLPGACERKGGMTKH